MVAQKVIAEFFTARRLSKARTSEIGRMPMVGIHMSIADAAIGKVSAGNSQRAQIIQAHPNHYHLGSIGPDIYYAPGVITNQIIQDLLQARRAFKDLTPDLRGMADQQVVDVAQDLINRASGILDTMYSSFLSVMNNVVALALPWSSVALEDPTSFDERGFSWADFTHYRANADFARALLTESQRSPTSPELSAFAYGYMSHIATDTVGHAFTNQIVGGPYRSRPTFHHVAEQHMDAWHWLVGRGANICSARLQDWIKIHQGSSPTLPGDRFVSGYNAALTAVYGPILDASGVNRAKLAEADIRTAYSGMFRSLEFATELSHVDPPVDPDTLAAILQDLADLAQSILDHARDIQARSQNWGLEHFNGGHFDFDDFRDALQDFGEAFMQDLEDLLEVAGAMLAAGTLVTLRSLIAVLYQIQLSAYAFWRTTRLLPVAMGLLYPEPDEILPEWHTVAHSPIQVPGEEAAAFFKAWLTRIAATTTVQATQLATRVAFWPNRAPA